MTESSDTRMTFRRRCRHHWAPVSRRFGELRERYPWLEAVRKSLVTLIGVLLIVVGAAISWLPGPGGFIAFIGIGILVSEYRWVRKLTRQIEAIGHRLYVRITGSKPRWWRRAKRKMSAGFAGG